MATATAPASLEELAELRLDQIEVKEDFNPRTDIERAELEDLTASIKARGNTTRVVVKPNDKGAERPYVLIAGERRYLATANAGRETILAIVKPANSGLADISIAMLENAHRKGLNPLDEAAGYARMLDEEPQTHGTRKGLAKFLGEPQKRITERLRILELPEDLLPHVASGEIPLSGISPLLKLQKIHADLPALAVDRVLKEPAETWMEDYDWGDLVDDPIWVVCGQGAIDQRGLPADVYLDHGAYPVDTFVLSDKARKNLEAWAKVRGCHPTDYRVFFSGESFEEALALKAGFECGERGFSNIVVGDDVASQLVENMTGRSLRQVRKQAREQAEASDQPDGSAANGDAGAEGAQPSANGDEPQAPVDSKAERERLKREREQARERQRKAAAHNHELGRLCVTEFATIKLDLRVIRILSNVNFATEIGQLAMRGARYGYPGWTEEVSINGGKASKVEYVTDRLDAAERIAAWLGHLKKPGELAGRLVGLVVMGRFAEEEALPEDERSGYQLPIPSVLGWRVTAMIDAIDELAAERLPDRLLKAKRDEYAERRRALEELEQRVETIVDRLDGGAELSAEDRDKLRSDIDSVWPRATQQWTYAMRKLEAIECQLAPEIDPDGKGDPRADTADAPTPDTLEDGALLEA